MRTDIDGATKVQWRAGSLVVSSYGAPEFVLATGAAREGAGVEGVKVR